jgi:asparagine synthase (glutamine-hydrolysing)
MLLDPRSLARPYIEKGKVEQLVKAHLTGTGNFTTAIHKLLTLELVHRNFIDGAGSDFRHQALAVPRLDTTEALVTGR